jgi:hypothetical protein
MAAAQTSQPLTVLDYYNLLPDKFFEADKTQRINWMLDPKRGAIVDLKNDYIFAPGDGAQSDIYISLLKKRGGGDLVIIKHHAPDSRDITSVEFYTYQNGAWTDVTKSVMPVAINEDYQYHVPRYCMGIQVNDKSGGWLYDLVWTGEKFRLRK